MSSKKISYFSRMDAFGNILRAGSRVAYTEKDVYKALVSGTVVRLTEKSAIIKPDNAGSRLATTRGKDTICRDLSYITILTEPNPPVLEAA
jgi:hypothetical protein